MRRPAPVAPGTPLRAIEVLHARPHISRHRWWPGGGEPVPGQRRAPRGAVDSQGMLRRHLSIRLRRRSTSLLSRCADVTTWPRLEDRLDERFELAPLSHRARGHNSGPVRLWYNGPAIESGSKRNAGSRFDATIDGVSTDFFLRTGFALDETA